MPLIFVEEQSGRTQHVTPPVERPLRNPQHGGTFGTRTAHRRNEHPHGVARLRDEHRLLKILAVVMDDRGPLVTEQLMAIEVRDQLADLFVLRLRPVAFTAFHRGQWSPKGEFKAAAVRPVDGLRRADLLQVRVHPRRVDMEVLPRRFPAAP